MENKSYTLKEASRILTEINASKRHANTKSLTLLIGVFVFIALTWSVFQGLKSFGATNGAAVFFLVAFIALYAISALGVVITCILSLISEPYAKAIKVDIPTEDGSIISYDKIADLNYKAYADAAAEATEETLLSDYLKQIYLASGITKIKNKFFNIGAIMAGVMFISTIIIIIINNIADWS